MTPKPLTHWSRLKQQARVIAAGSVLAAICALPRPALAFCHPCLMDSVISAADVLAKVGTLGQMAASQASTLAGIAASTAKTLLGQQGNTAAVVAGREKELAAEKELVQAELNYRAASDSQKRFAEAQDRFTAPSAQPFRVCETMSASETTTSMSDDARTMAKALNFASGKRLVSNVDAGIRGKAVLDNYRANYCSDADEERGRCTAVSDKRMHNASVSADSLMQPIAGETFSPKEAVAAADFIEMVTNPVPLEGLPKGLENKSSAAERFNLAQMSSQAQMSMANLSLVQILASKMPMGSSPEKSISFVGLMKKTVEEKFGNPEYAAGLSRMDSPGLLKEMNIQMAGRNWINYQTYLQNERVESLLATQLAIAVKDSSEREIAAARARVLTP